MIPYFEIPNLVLPGGVEITPFGALLIIGVIAASVYARVRGKEISIPPNELSAVFRWTFGLGLLCAQVGDVLMYRPGDLAANGVSALLDFSGGLSAFGGIIGGVAGFFIGTRSSSKSRLFHLDVIVESAVLAFVFFRLGCSIVHDHPGHLSNFFLAVQYPGGARHDLGLYEFLFVLALFPTLRLLRRNVTAAGLRTALVCFAYGLFRLVFDFLRATDLPGSEPRYFGFTPGQYCALVLIGLGIWLAVKTRSRGTILAS